jgi:hypothetical protein
MHGKTTLKIFLTSFRLKKFRNGSVKGHKIISLTVVPTQLGLSLNVMFVRVIKRHAGTGLLRRLGGGTCTFLFRVIYWGGSHLKQINYLQDGGRTFP